MTLKMTKKKLSIIAACCLLLASCTLLLGPQTALINALFEKFVGVSPLDAKIFENPMIKGRMKDLLGDKYDSTMKLLNTASAIQKEGPLYYVVSRYTPLPEFAEKAGFSYNSETNQMVVLLLKGDVHTLLFETVGKAAGKALPVLPKEMDLLIHPEKIIDKAIDTATGAAADAAASALGVDKSTADLLKDATTPDALQNMAADALKAKVNPAQTTPAATNPASDTPPKDFQPAPAP